MVNKPQVSSLHQDRQWDCRFNVQLQEDLDRLLNGIRSDWERGRLRYVLVGGPEIGTRPYQTDYETRHVHVAAIFHNRVSKSAILKNWNVRTGNGYYLVPRNRDFPYKGWREHHIKPATKINAEERILYENGELPSDNGAKFQAPSGEEKVKKVDTVIIEMRALIEEGKEAEAFQRFPRNYLIYGEKLKSMLDQKREFAKRPGDPHIWVHGFPGTGKSAVLNFIYPQYYKKNLHNRFFDLFNPKEHTHVMLEDLDHEALEKLSMNFVKTLCDEAGFAIDQKYKTPQLARATVLVTSNFTIDDLTHDVTGADQARRALYRRFWHINIMSLLRFLGLKLLPKYDRDMLKREGNDDPSKLFMTWDYYQDIPLGLPLKTPEEYQEIIRDTYFGLVEISQHEQEVKL